MKNLIILLTAGLTLTACSTMTTETPVVKGDIPVRGASESAQCTAERLQFMIGQKATGTSGERALKQSGAKTLRWIPPNSAVTMDYRQDRLNIAYDDQMTITRINCA